MRSQGSCHESFVWGAHGKIFDNFSYHGQIFILKGNWMGAGTIAGRPVRRLLQKSRYVMKRPTSGHSHEGWRRASERGIR